MTNPLKDKPRREYPANVVRFAQRLYDENGYTLPEIIASLERRGHTPTKETVKRWTDPDYKEAVNEARRTGGVRRTRTKPWKFRLARMRELRSIGLSASATARVMANDFGLSLSRHQVETLLTGEVRKHSTVKRLLYPEGV